ncbi:30S ribosomal protein S12 methylthiotransferase RimO [Ruminococcus sp. HUN007]|uniref:30S ribosomal protein S12 methylthiotransferase RimO n=1 Tax=Ruminococcus sp. HUN007 TaxID=1514668 RepID=UPI0005D22545|nr:30S ribosomal protein S12 methylthiotransferase RimO [Ruminococcus sp. HUN007]
MPVKIGMVSLGCSKNLVDSERMLYKVRERGYEIVTDPAKANVVIVNTCGFIKEAKEEAIETILELAKLKEEGTVKKIIATGCLVQRYKEEFEAEFTNEVDAVAGIGSEDEILSLIDKVLANEHVVEFKDKLLLECTGKRIITTLPFFTYLKIAEGCSNCCSYCAIPMIRGKYRSVPMEDVLEEAKWLAENGITEIIVVAQDSTRYGEDLYGKSRLPELLRELCKIDGLKWIRVLYSYPERITDELIDVIASEPKIVKYMDIPIQHSDEKILKAMGRGGSEAELRALFKKLREKIDGLVIRTTLITGFPGETEEQFNSMAEFIKDMEFDKLGCFPYSEEEGTKAATMPDQVDEEIRQHRAEIIMEQQQLISEQKNLRMIGKTVEAVVEGFDQWAECYFGRTAGDAPDIDGKIFFDCDHKLEIGQFVNVHVNESLDYDLMGEVTDEPAE